MRSSLIIALLMAAATAHAADPTNLDIPPPPPIPKDVPVDKQATEPEVTVLKKEDATITEYRVGGHVYMQKVQPKIGPPYYLVDDEGAGNMVRRDTEPVKAPMWTIKTF
jgi:hypothetical protein